MIRIELKDPGWASQGDSRARGSAHLDESFLEARDIAATLEGCASREAWVDTVRRLNGSFAAVTARGNSLVAAVDRLRSIPLFYAIERDDFFLSDSAHCVMQACQRREMDTVAGSEFELTGYVTGGETLFAGLLQLEAGAALCFDASKTSAPERSHYHEFRHRDHFREAGHALISRLESVHAAVFRRLLQGCGQRPIVIPLSGGYDSRLIGVSLRDLGARDVVCYSYGVPGNWESRISRELATYLGFRWEFVPYSAELWRAWSATDRFAEYFREAGNLSSVPHIQDWPAVLELQREARIHPGSIFVPGHSGDFLAGSHIPKAFADRATITRREVLDALQASHYSLWDWPPSARKGLKELFDHRIESVTGPIADGTSEEAADTFERWDLQERQAKFICNSMRVYEFFGFEWRLPLFDHELMDFWSRVPMGLRLGRKLYLDFARTRQKLPITAANTDYGSLMRMLVQAVDRSGLRPLAKRAQYAMRRARWRRWYAGAPLAWPGLIDRDQFRQTYTGKEILHSYMAARYRDYAATTISKLRSE
jgi:asparagine synthase (glutamine-hydrolysing)